MKMKNINKGAIIKFIFFIIVLLGIIFIATRVAPWLFGLVKNPENFRSEMLSLGFFGNIVFLALVILHVIIVVVPGDVFYFVSGFIFGTFQGFLLSYVGVMIGAFIVFNISRQLGYEFISKVIPKKKLDKAGEVLNSTKGMLGLFILCLIPIVLKGPMMYAAGLTPIKAPKLFLVYGLSRIAVILMWTGIGDNAHSKNYLQMTILIVVLVIAAFIVSWIYNKFGRKK